MLNALFLQADAIQAKRLDATNILRHLEKERRIEQGVESRGILNENLGTGRLYRGVDGGPIRRVSTHDLQRIGLRKGG